MALVPAGARLHALQAQQKLVEHIGIAVKIEQVGKRVFHQRADMLHAVAVIPCAQGVKAHFKIAGVQVWVLFCSQVKQVDALGHRGAAKGQVCPWAARQLRHLIHVRIFLNGAALEAEVVIRLKVEKDAEIHKDRRAQQRQHSCNFFQSVRPLSEIGIQEADGARQIPVVE